MERKQGFCVHCSLTQQWEGGPFSSFLSFSFFFFKYISLFSLVGFSTLLNSSYTQNCTKTPCLPNAKCEIRNGIEACYCNMGFSGNGVTICEGKQSLLFSSFGFFWKIKFWWDCFSPVQKLSVLHYIKLFDFMLLFKKKKKLN